MDEGCLVIQLGSEAPIMSLDSNGHILLCDNGDIRSGIIQNLQLDQERIIDISYKDYQMDFIPNGIQLFRRGKGEFKVDASYYSSTILTIL